MPNTASDKPTISMHAASAPIFTKMLQSLDAWLVRAEAHAAESRFDSKALFEARLFPDMLPLAKQVQIACDTSKLALARLSGTEAPKFDDNETNLAELRLRIGKTLSFIASVPAEAVDGTEDRAIELPMRNSEPLRYTGLSYLQQFALPNFFFHVTTAYALLRHNGVPLGKSDYLGR